MRSALKGQGVQKSAAQYALRAYRQMTKTDEKNDEGTLHGSFVTENSGYLEKKYQHRYDTRT